MLETARNIELNYEKEKEARNKEQQVRLARQTNRPEFNTSTVNASTPIKNTNTAPQTGTNQHQQMEVAVTFDPNPVCHHYPMTDPTGRGDWYELPANDSIINAAASAPVNQFTTNTTNTAGCNELWRYNNRANTYTRTNHQTCTTNPTSLNSLNNISLNSSDQRNSLKCYRCGEQGYMRHECKTDRVYCTHCRSPNHDTRACRKHQNNTPSPTNSHIPAGYHPTVTPPPLLGTATTGRTGTAAQGPWFQNYQDPHQPRNNNTTTTPTPFNGASPAPSANMTEALTQILTQVANNKKDEGQ